MGVVAAATKRLVLAGLFAKYPSLKARYGDLKRTITTQQEKVKKARVGNLLRSPFTWEAHMRTFPNKGGSEFKKYYKLSRKAFDEYVVKLRPHLMRILTASRDVIEAKLGITLRLLAGASVLDLMRVFHVANPTIYYTVFYETLDALLVVLPPMAHPFDTSDKLETLAAVFFLSGLRGRPACSATSWGPSMVSRSKLRSLRSGRME